MNHVVQDQERSVDLSKNPEIEAQAQGQGRTQQRPQQRPLLCPPEMLMYYYRVSAVQGACDSGVTVHPHTATFTYPLNVDLCVLCSERDLP